MAASEVTVTQIWVIEGGSEKRTPWRVKDYETIAGEHFVPLCKRDTGLCRFVTGKKEELRHCTWLEELKLKTVRASLDDLTPETGPSLFETAQPKKQWARRKELEKIKHAIDADDPGFVTIALPAVSFEGQTAPDMSFKVKRSLDCKMTVLVELKAEVLRYIRIAMLDSYQRHARKRQRAEHDGIRHKIRWCNSRRGFIARRQDQKLKMFKPNKGTSVHDAKDKAISWADGDNKSGDESDDKVEKPSILQLLTYNGHDGSNEQGFIVGPAIDASAFDA